jgi:NAD(P)-dependent dehydrogenase (short-subunit alcohol dehydrogenase family)
MTSTPIVLILGTGPRVGAAICKTFAADGYKIATASRKGSESKSDDGILSIKADFTQPESIPSVFDSIKAKFGAAPSIVIYNAATFTPPPDKESTLSIPGAAVTSDLNVNVVSPYVAAQEAVRGSATLSAEAKKVFIYTGNIQNQVVVPIPMMLTLGVGKAAVAYWIGVADAAYSVQGYR